MHRPCRLIFFFRDSESAPFQLQMGIIHSFVDRHLRLEETERRNTRPCIMERSCMSCRFFIHQNEAMFSSFERAICVKLAESVYNVLERPRARFIHLQVL